MLVLLGDAIAAEVTCLSGTAEEKEGRQALEGRACCHGRRQETEEGAILIRNVFGDAVASEVVHVLLVGGGAEEEEAGDQDDTKGQGRE